MHTHTSRNLSREPLFIPHLPKLLSELTSAVMDENPRFSEVLNLSELKEAFCTSCLRLLFWRRHTDSVTKNMLTISTKPSACMSACILPPFRLRATVLSERTSGVEAFTTNHVP